MGYELQLKHCNAKSSLNASAKCSNTDTDPQSENNVNIVCDVAYDIIDSTYDVQSRTYDIAYDDTRTTL